MRTTWRYALKECRSLGLLISMFRLGVIRSGNMDTWDGSKERNPI